MTPNTRIHLQFTQRHCYTLDTAPLSRPLWQMSLASSYSLQLSTRHRASTSTYSLTFHVRVATPAQYGRNGTASLQITSHTQQARQFYRWCVRACVVRAACAGPGGLPLGSATHFHNVAIAMPPNSAQLGGIPYHPPCYIQVRAIVWACGHGQTHRRA